MRRWTLPAVAGVLAVVAGAAVGELVAALLGRPQSGTVVAVGAVVVDATPTPVKEFAVATLGTADKPVLLGGIALVLVVLAAALGVLARRDLRAGVAGAVLLGLVGTAAALTRPAAQLVDALPSLVGLLVIAGALVVLVRPLRAPSVVTAPATGTVTTSETGATVDRRAFVTAAALVAVAATGAAGGAVALGRGPPGVSTVTVDVQVRRYHPPSG